MNDSTLTNFVLRVKYGEKFGKDITPEVLEYVAEGVSKYLNGSKTPWPKKRGRKGSPKSKDFQIWYSYHISAKPKIRGGDLLNNLCEDYNLSESGVLDAVRRVKNIAMTALSENDLPEDSTPWTQLKFLLEFGHKKMEVIKRNSYWVK